MEKDTITKEIFKNIVEDIAKYILKLEIQNLSFIDMESQRIESRRADIVALVDDKFILHIELQSSYDSEMPYRMLRYYTDIKQNNKKYPIHQYVVYLGKQNIKNNLKDAGLDYNYNLIDMKKIDCEYFLEQNTPDALVLAILCDFKTKSETEVINFILNKLKKLTDENGFRRYVIMLEELAKTQEVKDGIKELKMRLSDVKFEDLVSYQIVLERGFNKGISQGKKETLKKAIFSLLEFTNDLNLIANKLEIDKEFLIEIIKEKQ